VFLCIGAYSVRANPADVLIVLGFGFVGYAMRLADLPAAPLLLGFVLGPLVEMQFRRSMVLARGDVIDVISRPIAGTVLAISLAILVWTLVGAIVRYCHGRKDLNEPSTGK